jgi:hypothetical protein
MVESVHPLPDDISYVNGYNTIHASPLEQRWGGWWVTGNPGRVRHMGNIPVMPADKGKSKLANPTAPLASVEGQFDLAGYPTPFSDVVAQMVLAHQVRMTNMITRTGWEARLAAAAPSADASARLREAASDLVDYLLFVDEAPLVGAMQGIVWVRRVVCETGGRATRRAVRSVNSIFVAGCSSIPAAT